jgi:hypothetical protein
MIESVKLVSCRMSGGLHVRQNIWGRILFRESFYHVQQGCVLLVQYAAPIFLNRLVKATIC